MSFAAFIPLSVLLIALALAVVISRNPIHSAVSLVAALFVLAATYAALGAHLVAVLQILVYAGAIMVLFLFVIMLLNLQQEPRAITQRLLPATAAALSAGLGLIIVSALAFSGPRLPGPGGTTALPVGYGSTERISELLFTRYLLPFEITSILLLVAIVGAVVIARRVPK